MSSLLFYSVLGFGTLTLGKSQCFHDFLSRLRKTRKGARSGISSCRAKMNSQTMTVAKSCASSNFTINSATKASPLADCSTFIGDVVITRSADPQIDLSGPTQIEGDVIMENNGGVIVLSSSSLTTITGLLALENVTLLSTLNMPALTSVGSIHWVSLPALNSLSFTSGITKAGNISVVNTFLSSLEGIEPSSIGELRIVSNRRLRKIDLPIRNITGNLTFQHNGVKAQIVSSNPVVAKALNINNVTSFEASRREAIGGHAQLNSDYFALPLLTTIGGLASFDDSQFNNLKAPSLENCGGLIITNNPTLTDIDLPALKTISGQLKMTNNTMLETVDGLKGLTTVLTDIKVRGLLSR